jgi:hypothetical protein
MERLKYRDYKNRYANTYFWRSYSQKEIDLIEDYDGQTHSYEFKWTKAYPDSSYNVINRDNYLDFVIN